MTASPGAARSWRAMVRPHGPWSRVEWLDEVGSTNDVVMGWLRDGTASLCLAIADEQTAGRGRAGRRWSAPKNAALLCSVGFTPSWLETGDEWRLAALVSLAMTEAGEEIAGVPSGTIRLKWPNDLVVVDPESGAVRKLAGVLGETEGAGTSDSKAVVGIGVNAGWPRAEFPAELADSMTSLGEVGGGRQIDREALLDAFMDHLEPLEANLRRDGGFPAERWRERQLTNGTLVRLEWPDGTAETVHAIDVDPATGALLVRAPDGSGPARAVVVGEIRHLRVGVPAAGGV